MKIQTIEIKKFKRFSSLLIQDIPQSAKLVILAGPNGCGKSSLFDAFKRWHVQQAELGWQHDPIYYQRSTADSYIHGRDIIINFHEGLPQTPELRSKCFYFRSAYRNDSDFTIQSLSRVSPVLKENRFHKMIDNDLAVSSNYQRIASQALEDIFVRESETTTIGDFRERIIGRIREAMQRIFPELILNNLGSPLESGTFRFDKGTIRGFLYKNLSAGEKACFDLILDFVVKSRDFNNTIYCIDEPETHINTKLQGDLLGELVKLIPEGSQLWLATHSIGMMNKARKLNIATPGEVAFIEFGGHNFDQNITLKPVQPSRNFWENVLKIALDDLSDLIVPKEIIVCEGNNSGGKNSNHDADCYNKIFSIEFPDVQFVSGGNSNEVSNDRYGFISQLPMLARGVLVRNLIDRDDHAPEDIQRYKVRGIAVLTQRNLESFLYDDEILTLLCQQSRQAEPELIAAVLTEKADAIRASVQRGNPPDDIRSAAGDIVVKIKRRLGITASGNDTRAFERITLAPLIKPNTQTYASLKNAVFPST